MLFGRDLHWTVVVLPLIVVLQVLFILGLTYFMAVLGTYLPDLGEVMRPVIRGTFFLTPIIWTPDRLPEIIRWVVDYNPLAYLVNAYREVVLLGTCRAASRPCTSRFSRWRSSSSGSRCSTGSRGGSRTSYDPRNLSKGRGEDGTGSPPAGSSWMKDLLTPGKANSTHEFWAVRGR